MTMENLMLQGLTKTQAAIINGVSLFHNHKVKSISDGMGKTERVIKRSTNVKLGKVVTKGRFKGYPIYTVTLEERATCDSGCFHYKTCYGNNMPFATRYKADNHLIPTMHNELIELQRKHPNGFLVRLHILGDFFSVDYVNQWAQWLELFPALNVYGYTERKRNTTIGKLVYAMQGSRFMVRTSGDTTAPTMTALSFDDDLGAAKVVSKEAFICPVQLDKVNDCGSCGLCWQASKPVIFLTH
jgi:hypothetical protein